MLTNTITVGCIQIDMAALSDVELAVIRDEIVREITARRRCSQRELEIPARRKIFLGMWPLPPVAAKDDQ